jgi:hypothetical protein
MVNRAAAAVALSALALAGPGVAHAADSERRIWDAYPLPKPDAQQSSGQVVSQAPPTDMVAAPSEEVERLVLASFLALVGGAALAWLVTVRWPPGRPGALVPATALAPDAVARVRSATPELWVHSVAPAVEHAAPAAAPPPRPLAPPDPGQAWAAEIGWDVVDGGAQFRVVARPVDGGEQVVLDESPPLEWPPSGARAVQALTDAVRAFESALVAAGWAPLPRGSAWYAKRFTWQPGASPRPAPVQRIRHRRLYESEFARQVDKTERLRRTIGERLLGDEGGAR